MPLRLSQQVAIPAALPPRMSELRLSPPGNTYYYKVTATVGGAETELFSSSFTTSGNVRMIKADGVSNIRDLGGWTTASGNTIVYGKIFRGAAFTSTTITQEGIDAVRATGVKAELDLRDGSQDGSMSASLLGSDVEYVSPNEVIALGDRF